MLDNVEQVIAPAAAVVSALLGAAPNARFLVTSREALFIAGESVVELAAIGLPSEDASESDVRGSEAIELLFTHVRSRRVFEPDPNELALAARLVRRLDGIPLAIELAAARLASSDTGTLGARIEKSIDALGRGARDKVDRHQTLRAAIEWSLDLLSKGERRAFTEAAVFPGSFDLALAEEVLLTPDAVRHIEALTLKSLARAFDVGAVPGTRRIALYETMRSVARERLAADANRAELARRFARAMASRGTALRAEIERSGAGISMRRLGLERASLDEALASVRADREGDGEVAAALLFALERLLHASGEIERLTDEVRWIEERFPALAPRTRAQLARVEGDAHVLAGRMDASRRALDRAIRCAEESGDLALTARLRLSRAHKELHASAEVIAEVEAALALLRVHGGAREIAIAANELGVRHSQLGHDEQAQALVEESRHAFARAGDQNWEGVACCQVAILAMERGDRARAHRAIEDAMHIAAEDQGWNLVGMAAQVRGYLAHDEGRLGDAARAYEEGIGVFARVGSAYYEALLRGFAGIAARELGALDRADRALDDAVRALSDTGEKRYRAVFLGHLGALRAERGDTAAGGALVEQAHALALDGSFPGSVVVSILERAHVDLAIADAAERRGEPRAMHAGRRRALEALEGGRGRARPLEVRLSERLLEARLAGAPTHVPAPGPVPNDTLVVERDARWFRAPGAEAVGLTGKHLSRRLLLRLVRGRLEAPGESIVVESLLEAGWPGERIHPDAAKNRLFVALNTLRKLGLAPFLESVGGGYRLDPKVPLRLG